MLLLAKPTSICLGDGCVLIIRNNDLLLFVLEKETTKRLSKLLGETAIQNEVNGRVYGR